MRLEEEEEEGVPLLRSPPDNRTFDAGREVEAHLVSRERPGRLTEANSLLLLLSFLFVLFLPGLLFLPYTIIVFAMR